MAATVYAVCNQKAELNAILDNEERGGGDALEEEKEQDAGDGGRAEDAGQQGCRVASGEDRD